jgi:hypothetical protein
MRVPAMDYELTKKVLAALERDVSVSVVTPEMLYRMKKGTVRPKGWGDAQRIARRFGLKE